MRYRIPLSYSDGLETELTVEGPDVGMDPGRMAELRTRYAGYAELGEPVADPRPPREECPVCGSPACLEARRAGTPMLCD